MCEQNQIYSVRMFRQVNKETFETDLFRLGTFGNTVNVIQKRPKG